MRKVRYIGNMSVVSTGFIILIRIFNFLNRLIALSKVFQFVFSDSHMMVTFSSNKFSIAASGPENSVPARG
ncbi:MAG: hypothetical protein CM15mP23_05250 [Cryomorphaceae bacterium]|nr:MAG: hypothetical protein CM15mP23_05250 [Cryomorphaceae bacterium]